MCSRVPSMARGSASNVYGCISRMASKMPRRCVIATVTFYPPSLTKPADLLPGGCNVEALKTYKHRTPTGCYYRSLPACLRLGVRRGPTRLHQEEPQCRSTQTCRCPRYRVSLILTPAASCLMSLRVSTTSTSAISFMVISKEHVVF